MICGAHQSVSGGLHLALERGVLDGCKAVQVFTKNSAMWREPVLTEAQIKAFRDAHTAFGSGPVLAHTSYLINLATEDRDLSKRSIDALVSEVQRASALGIAYCVLHPGAHLNAGEERGLQRVVEALDEAHARTEGASAMILLENTAGQGTCVGHRFEHLAAIFDGVHAKERLGVCFDTQHAYAAGYDLATRDGYAKTWVQFESMVGLSRVRAFHLNDSKKPLGSRVDRHEHLGEGNLGLPLFWRLVNDPRFANVPGVVETEPRDGDNPFKQEVDLLRALEGAPEPRPAPPVFTLELVESASRSGRRAEACSTNRAVSRSV